MRLATFNVDGTEDGGCVTGGGVWLFPHYDGMTSAVHAASDHAAVWVDLDL